MAPRWLLGPALLVPVVIEGCDADSHPAPPVYLRPLVLDAGAPSPPERDVGAPASIDPPLLPDWCHGERAASVGASGRSSEIAQSYSSAQERSCAALTGPMLPDQFALWTTYLDEYSSVMTGCVDLLTPPPGGILAFGPANTAAIGLPHGPLSRGDADLLIATYLAAFASALSLTAEDQARVEAHLWRSAEPEIDASQGDALALCAGFADAGN